MSYSTMYIPNGSLSYYLAWDDVESSLIMLCRIAYLYKQWILPFIGEIWEVLSHYFRRFVLDTIGGYYAGDIRVLFNWTFARSIRVNQCLIFLSLDLSKLRPKHMFFQARGPRGKLWFYRNMCFSKREGHMANSDSIVIYYISFNSLWDYRTFLSHF